MHAEDMHANDINAEDIHPEDTKDGTRCTRLSGKGHLGPHRRQHVYMKQKKSILTAKRSCGQQEKENAYIVNQEDMTPTIRTYCQVHMQSPGEEVRHAHNPTATSRRSRRAPAVKEKIKDVTHSAATRR